MAKKQKRHEDDTKQKNSSRNSRKLNIADETRHGVYGICAFVVALFLVLAAFHGGGVAGSFIYHLMRLLFGIGYFLFPILFLILGLTFVQSIKPTIALSHTVASILFLASSLGIIDIASGTNQSGGIIGKLVAWPFVALFDTTASILFLGALLLISLFLLFDTRPNLRPLIEIIRGWFRKKEILEDEYETVDEEVVEEEVEDEEETEPEEPKQEEKKKEIIPEVVPNEHEDFFATSDKKRKAYSAYVPPPLSLLERDRGKPNTGDIKANANIIKRTLENFGIEVEMDEITIGPTVTRYALKPAQGVKLSRIVALQNDLALALAAHPIRIEAPIPGKSLVGIELPNRSKSIVGLGSLLSEPDFQNSHKPLMVALGKNVPGKSIFINLAKAPHALIAGTTGSGKSVSIHAIITSLLYRNSPDDLRLIMVDPKRVELTLYNSIPHLLTPVITDAKKCILALKWAAKEMDRRYDLLQTNSARDIQSYHANVLSGNKKHGEDEPDRMPYIVIIIDELADIMASYPRELEGAIVRLAQMSRAVGIHLILSTQRPEVNVITGLIKANIPTRIALRVPTQVDSRTILDASGAEKLLGSGDMLFSGGEGQPERMQSAFITEEEVKKVVKYFKDAYRDEVPNDINLSGPLAPDNSIFSTSLTDEDSDEDELYEEARAIVIETQKASTSFLQRKLGIGYARAARLIDILEERGVVGAGNGAKPRDVLEKTIEAEKAGFE